MRVILLLLIFTLAGCANNFRQEAFFCFASENKARDTANYLIDNGFYQRVRFLIDGETASIQGLGFMWAGFNHSDSCDANEFPLKIIYEPDQTPAFDRNQVIPMAKLTYSAMLRERGRSN
ncbi:hypothetical protein JQC92_16840 [Shewanella sp. 202IG2-18]|uniref:hypothetical protein n=1 Tax=Parashewanella hymeniacidonis TaxID=2807618 RepID=UPI00196051EB|nr:hypothetical protein [Parashewanella hymeniacidonis]MBM7073678.1 hypothetical protein [Parashewanella hymeniacidonis]